MIGKQKEIIETFLPVFEFALDKFTGREKRLYLAHISKTLGFGGAKLVCDTFGINFRTLQKGQEELKSGIPIIDAFGNRGRNKVEGKLPNLLTDIKYIIDNESQADPRFEENKLFTRLTAEEIRWQLHEQFDYKLSELPTSRTIYNKVIDVGYCLTKIQKTKPLKKIAQTDAIFKKN